MEQVIVNMGFLKMLFTSFFCGSIIGIERQLKGRPAGIRTSSLVCLGTASFVYLGSAHGYEPEFAIRVVSAIISGVGFLGAGVILNLRGHVRGVTSAAVIWSLASIGCYIGLGQYAEGIVISMIVLFLLVVVQAIESYVERLRIGMYDHDILNNTGSFNEESN
ncbi:MAG: MgtC/SapB family protein [Bdellovibrionales bacterium]|nr:MgtC/SapB family protein [Bdellovibrionales bacterium]